VGQFYVRNNKVKWNLPLSTLTKFESRPGPEFTMRFNMYQIGPTQWGRRAGY
jgi:hypothetical protein